MAEVSARAGPGVVGSGGQGPGETECKVAGALAGVLRVGLAVGAVAWMSLGGSVGWLGASGVAEGVGVGMSLGRAVGWPACGSGTVGWPSCGGGVWNGVEPPLVRVAMLSGGWCGSWSEGMAVVSVVAAVAGVLVAGASVAAL